MNHQDRVRNGRKIKTNMGNFRNSRTEGESAGKMYKYKEYRSPVGKIILCSYRNALTALFFEGQKYADRYTDRYLRGTYCPEGNPVLDRTHAWLDRYFAGERPDPSEIRLAPEGTPFQCQVWDELLKIPYGTTDTYGAIARRLHSGSQAVGGAVGRNPISIIIPCHRVLGTDGCLTGYAAGLAVKEKLLEIEGCM